MCIRCDGDMHDDVHDDDDEHEHEHNEHADDDEYEHDGDKHDDDACVHCSRWLWQKKKQRHFKKADGGRRLTMRSLVFVSEAVGTCATSPTSWCFSLVSSDCFAD